MTLELRGVSKRFPGVLAVDNVSFSAPAGEITGYLGPNGSGKSTTMKMIVGLIEIGSGEILFGGEPIRHDLVAHKRRTGYVPEEPHEPAAAIRHARREPSCLGHHAMSLTLLVCTAVFQSVSRWLDAQPARLPAIG
jgi:ABC-type Mn2+/Zn2+ transport system ATPase subunit